MNTKTLVENYGLSDTVLETSLIRIAMVDLVSDGLRPIGLSAFVVHCRCLRLIRAAFPTSSAAEFSSQCGLF